MNKLSLLTFVFSILLLMACDNSQQQESTTATQSKPSAEPTEMNHTDSKAQSKEAPPTTTADPSVEAPQKAEQQIMYTWVDKLSLREKPDGKSSVVKLLKEGEALIYNGEKTDTKEEITLRGVNYNEPWMKVTTNDGKSGWVFGGAIKRNDEKKGTTKKAIVIDIPHFGRYDLNNWVKTNSMDASGGDAEINTEIYTAGDLTLQIAKGEVGEYGYSRTITLTGPDDKKIKARHLEWMSAGEGFILTEKVFDFTKEPVISFIRTQKFVKHFMQLKSKPETVKGKFKEGTLSKAKADQIIKDLF